MKSAVGSPCSSTGTIDEYWLAHTTDSTLAAASGARAVAAHTARTTASHIAVGLWVTASPSRAVGIRLEALAATVPSSATSTAFAFVVPTSSPSAWRIEGV